MVRTEALKYIQLLHERGEGSALDSYEELIKRLFVDCRGHCPNLQRRLKEQLGLAVQLHTLQKFCQPWRKTVLTPQERAVRYEVNLPDR